MTRFAIDAEALIELVLDGREVDPAHQLVAPNSIRSQAMELLLTRVRAGEMTERQALELHERITELKMRLLGDRVSRRAAWRLAREQDWESLSYAEYLAVTRLQADALIAGAPGLVEAARGIVALVPLQALFR